MTRRNTRLASLRSACAAGALFAAAGADQALAWGHTGHVEIGQAAIAALPSEIPPFLRSAAAVRQIGELSPEPDVSKSSGDAATPNSDIHDFQRDSGHYIDLDDSGDVLGFASLPLSSLLTPSMGQRDFDTALRAASVTAGKPLGTQTQYSGYLPYTIVDGWQQVRKDFAYIRAFTAAIANPATAAADRSFFQYQLQLRQTLTLRDIGVWSHYVEDGSQPLHVSIHFNGWGNYPNPNGYTTAGVHAQFEGLFVKNNISAADILAEIGPYAPCNCAGVEPRVRSYLAATLATVEQLYTVEKLSPGFLASDPTQVAFATSRLAAGAAELRDEIVDAWRSSDTVFVGYPLIKVADIESGAVVWSANKFAGD